MPAVAYHGPSRPDRCHAGCLHSCGLEGFPHRRFHRLIDPPAADCQAGRGAPIDPASPADIPWHAPGGTAINALELAAAAPTPQQTTAQRHAPFGRATGCILWPRALGLQELLVLEKHLPTDGARVLPQQHDAPLLPWLFPPCALASPPIFEYGLGLGTPLDQGSSIARIGRHLMHTMATGQLPQEVVASRPRVPCGQRQLRITVPQHGLPGTPECAKLLEDPIQRLLPLTVSDLFQAMVFCADTAHRDFPHAMAAANFLFEGFPRPLPHQAQRIFGHRALHPQDEAIMQVAWIIDPIIIHQQGLRQGAEIDQMVPVTLIPCQAGRFQGDNAPDMPCTHGRQQLAKARARLQTCATAASVLIKDDDLPKAQGAGTIR